MKKIFCCPALELFCCLPLWKTVLFVSSRAFSLSTPVENSKATWKKATKCNKPCLLVLRVALLPVHLDLVLLNGNHKWLKHPVLVLEPDSLLDKILGYRTSE